jgi:hypothetical protein
VIRSELVGLTLILTLLGAASACSDDEETSSVDINGLTGEIGAPVEAPGRVISVSPRGRVLVARDGQTCIAELDATVDTCLDVALFEGEPLRWSADGARAVAGSQRRLATVEDTDLVVIDIEEGTSSVLTDDGTDDAMSADVDLYPTWLDDDTVGFLRLSGGIDAERLDAVRATVDGEEKASAETELELTTVRWGGNTFGDELLVSAARDGRTELLGVDERGGTEEVFSFEGAGGPIGESSADRQALAVSTADSRQLVAAPVAYLRVGDDPVMSDFDGFAASVDPSGQLVATTSGTDLLAMQLAIWDPSDGTIVELGEVQAPIGITWIAGDRLVLWYLGGWRVVELNAE